MNDIFPSIEQIEKAMHGRGRVIAKKRRFASEAIAILIIRGWSRSFVTRVFRSLDDRDVGSHTPAFFLEKWAKYRASLISEMTFVEILQQIGVRPSIISILERRIYTNLVNTCYSEPQLVDIAIEYLLRRRVPITKRDPLATMTHPFSPGIMGGPGRMSSPGIMSMWLMLPPTHVLHYHTTSLEGRIALFKQQLRMINAERALILISGQYSVYRKKFMVH
jgi:hypothetical protein